MKKTMISSLWVLAPIVGYTTTSLFGPVVGVLSAVALWLGWRFIYFKMYPEERSSKK